MQEIDTDALQMFAEYQRSQGLSPATVRNRHSILNVLGRECGSIVDLDVFTLRRYVGRESVKASTRATERKAIRSFYTFLFEEGLRADNPGNRLPPIKVPRAEPRPFSSEQIDAMLTSGAYSSTRAMILLGYHQGFRVSSISRVHGDDIDRLSNTIRTIVKGNKVRVLPLHPVIRELAVSMPQHAWWFPARKDPTKPMRPTSVTDLITRAKKRAGILDPELTPHSLRHSFGSELVEAEVDIRVVQELMCHEDLSSTQIYTRVSDRRKHAGLAALPGHAIPTSSGRGRHPEAA